MSHRIYILMTILLSEVAWTQPLAELCDPDAKVIASSYVRSNTGNPTISKNYVITTIKIISPSVTSQSDANSNSKISTHHQSLPEISPESKTSSQLRSPDMSGCVQMGERISSDIQPVVTHGSRKAVNDGSNDIL
jgi:hypothetical protein